MRRHVVGVMGGTEATEEDKKVAEELGARIAKRGWVLLTGGRPLGIMQAASKGASEAGGLVVGVLYGAEPNEANAYVDIAIATDMADARNLINVLSSDVVVACPGSTGTLCEVALAAKRNKPLVLLGFDAGPMVPTGPRVAKVHSAAEAETQIASFLNS